MDAMIDWDEAAKKLKRDVGEHGGFLTMQRDELRERFGIGKLGVKISEDLWTTLYEAGMIVFPHPYDTCGNTVRVYADESDIGKNCAGRRRPTDCSRDGTRRHRGSVPTSERSTGRAFGRRTMVDST